MSYYISHTLILPDDYDENVLHQEQITDKYGFGFDGDCDATWYDSIKDMKEYSQSYPDTLFMLEYEGERNLDVYKAYFKNGKSWISKPKIVWGEFDESQLQ